MKRKQRNENEILRSPNLSRSIRIMSRKCINLESFYYVIFDFCHFYRTHTIPQADRNHPPFSYSINFVPERWSKKHENYVGVFKLNETWMEEEKEAEEMFSRIYITFFVSPKRKRSVWWE